MSRKENSTARRPTLSLSMIIKNEEKFLAGCLESVRGIVDELVIVDTGSTDGSKRIAEDFGARVFDFEWIGDFSAARNFSLRQCTGDWILYLDADERLKENQATLIRRAISANDVGAYTFVIENPHSLQQGNFKQENSYPRLFRRLPGVEFEGKVHEQVWPSLMRQKITVRQSELVIRHLGYDQGYDVVRQKAERNLSLLRAQLAENPGDGYAQFQIGNSLVVLQRYEEARPELERAIANGKLHSSNLASCYNLLAEVEVRSTNLKAAIECCRQSLQVAPRQVMAHWFLSLLYSDLGDHENALRAVQMVEQFVHQPSPQRTHQIASDLDVSHADVVKRYAQVYERAGRYDEALERYTYLLQHDAGLDDAAAGFLRCVEKADDARLAIRKLLRASNQLAARKELFLPLAQHCRKKNDQATALQLVDKALVADPTDGRAYALAVQWMMEANQPEDAGRMLAAAESKGIRFFELHKAGMQLALRNGDLHAAFRQLELMAQTTDADLTPLKSRIEALRSRL
jgi:tetratricopeptide (TPR) repeat protein